MSKQNRIFLSIDADYFNHSHESIESALETILSRFPRERLAVVTNHQQALYFTNKMDFDTLINVDMHGDLSDVEGELQCGNWVNYVKGKEQKIYKWIHPHERKSEAGFYSCFVDELIFLKNRPTMGYKKYQVQYKAEINNWLKKILKQTVFVCIARSPDYSSETVQWGLIDYCKANKIKIMRGSIDESKSRMRRIP